MKNMLIITILLLPNSVCARSSFFVHPTESWSIPDNQHYNTYKEDENHVCHKKDGYLIDKAACERLPIEGYIGEYVKRDCGYGGNCSDSIQYHAGIDYDYPNHQHDSVDYTADGKRKDTDLEQGSKKKWPCSEEQYDYIVASGPGKVVYADDPNPTRGIEQHGWGSIVRIRHVCDPHNPKAKVLCASEGKDMVIYTQYAHLSEIAVKQGDYVYRNDKIGRIGGSGNWIHHLHLEFKTKNSNGKGYINVEGKKPSKDIVTKQLKSNGYRNPFDFISPDGVMWIDRRVRLAKTGGGLQCVGAICWAPTNATCLDADNWYQFIDDEPVQKTIAICNDINKVSGGTSTQPTEPPTSGKLPDFITNKVILANESGSKEKYTWKVNETAYVHSWTDNIGKKDWEGKAKKIKVPFYLSKGTKEDSHSTWVRAGREEIKKDNLDVKDKPKHEKIAFSIRQWAAAGYIYPGRTYNFVVCADRPNDQDNGDGDVKEVHKSNNCSTPAVFYVDYGPARNVDVMASNLALAGGKSSLQAGEAYGFQADISNIGTQYPWNGCRTNYEIKGPGTGDVWQKVADEGSTVAQLGPNSTHVEVIDESRGLKAPSVGGDYVFRACADYEQAIPEIDESNNCTAELPVTVEAPLPPPPPAVTPRIVITNPTHTDKWRSSSKEHDIKWERHDFPTPGNVKIEYSLDGGATWLVIDDSTTNDEKKHWEDMCDFHTIDTHNAMIRITSLEYPDVSDVSGEFSIDHAKECK